MTTNTILENLSWIDTIAGGVWLVLTVLMMLIIVRINKIAGWRNSYMYGMILLVIMVYLYPLYTGFFSNLIAGEVGNIFTLLLTAAVMMKIRDLSVPMSRVLIPQMLWLSVATIYVGLQLAQ